MATGTIQPGSQPQLPGQPPLPGQAPVPGRAPAGKESSYDGPHSSFIVDELNRTRSSVKLVDLGSSLILLLTGVLAFVLAMSFVDHWLFNLGTAGRWLACLALIGGLGWFLTTRVIPAIVRGINPIYAAHTIEKNQPWLKNSLVNFLLLRRDRQQVKEVVYEAVEQQAAANMHRVDADHTVDTSPLIRLGYVLAGLVVIGGLYKILSPKDPFQTFARILAPWADISRPTRATIAEVTPGDTEVLYSQSLPVSVEVRGLRGEELPRIVFSTVDGKVVDRTIDMAPTDIQGTFLASLPEGGNGLGVQSDLTYRIEAGDAKSRDYRVQVQAAPSIVVREIKIDHPPYANLPQKLELNNGNIEALAGSRVTITAEANWEIEGAYLEFDPDKAAASSRPVAWRRTMKVTDNRATVSFELGLVADEKDKNKFNAEFSSYQLRFWIPQRDAAGEKIFNTQPARYSIVVTPDVAPIVEILKPEKEELELPLDGKAAIEVRAYDPDFALSKVKLRGEFAGEKKLDQVLYSDQKKRERPVDAFELVPRNLKLKAGDTLLVWAEAEDNRQTFAKAPLPNVSRTRTYKFRITEPEGKSQQNSSSQQSSSQQSSNSQQNNSQQNNSTQQQNSPQQNGSLQNDPSKQNGSQQQDPSKGSSSDKNQADKNQQQPAGGDSKKTDAGSDASQSPQAGPKGSRPQDGDKKPGEQDQNPSQGSQQPSGEDSKDPTKQDSSSQPQNQPGSEKQPDSEQQPGGEKQDGNEKQPGGNQAGSSPRQSGENQQGSSQKSGDKKEGSESDNSQSAEDGNKPNAAGSQQAGQKSQEDSKPVDSSGAKDDEAFERIAKYIKEQQQKKQQQQDGSSQQPQDNQQANADKRQGSDQRPAGDRQNADNDQNSDKNPAAGSEGKAGEKPSASNPAEKSGNDSDSQPGGAKDREDEKPGKSDKPDGQQSAKLDKGNGAGGDKQNSTSQQPAGPDSKEEGKGEGAGKPMPSDKPSSGDKPSPDPSSSMKPGEQGASNSGDKSPGDKSPEQAGDKSSDKSGKAGDKQSELPKGTPQGQQKSADGQTPTHENDSKPPEGSSGQSTTGKPSGDKKQQDPAQKGSPMTGNGQDQKGNPQKPDGKTPGTDGQGQQGQTGDGQDKSNPTKGTPQAQGDNVAKDPTKQNDSKTQQPNEKKPGEEGNSPSTSPKQSNTKGQTDGEKSGDGKTGGGQPAKQPGQSQPGTETPSEQGNGQAKEPGQGDTSKKPGDDKTSPDKTGKSGDERGAGSNTRASDQGDKSKSGDNPAEAGNNSPGDNTQGSQRDPKQGDPKQGDPKQGDPKQRDPKQRDSKSGEPSKDANSSNQPASSDRNSGEGKSSERKPSDAKSQSGAERGGNPSRNRNDDEKDIRSSSNDPTIGGGQVGAKPRSSNGPPPKIDSSADAANLDHARKTTDMVLDYLKHNKDPRLREKLGWSQQEADAFVERWSKLKSSAQSSPKAKQNLEDRLRGLGLSQTQTSVRAGTTKKDSIGTGDAGSGTSAPSKYKDKYNAYLKGTSQGTP